ncbi:MAG: YitT family protein [Oscillospiraceae bacterium]|nr:YitT family protein [Oscillospiraceae bacterium]
MKKTVAFIWWALRIAFGCSLYGLAFNLFLNPSGTNAGGISGLAMIVVHWTGFSTVGTLTAVVNLPLLLIGGLRINRKYMIGSVIGTASIALTIDLFAILPPVQVDPLMAAIYGGVLGGAGLGVVLSAGGSTGGSDIVVRLLKKRYQNVPIGIITMCFDLVVVALTGIVFRDITKSLYSGITVFICGRVVDAVVYSFDYSKVAMIMSPKYEQIIQAISQQLNRGATLLYGEGGYSRQEMKVVLTTVKRQQLAELKALVVGIDPDAFIIVQEAHQVLGQGFVRYSKDSL